MTAGYTFRSRRTLWIALLLLFIIGGPTEAKDLPRVRMKMELMSIRNRSQGPLPVHIKLEYNLPQILEGDLELSIYDALETFSKEDLMATLRHEGIVLAGRDYEFNVVLPPLRTAVTQNWAIEAFFVTENERIPLSSIPDRPDPPEAHDLLTTSPMERGVLLCSCAADSVVSPSANRRFLEAALSLDRYNPLYGQQAERQQVPGEASNTGSKLEKIGRTVIHFAGQWSARDLPLDPLSYCAFDAVLLSDGALARLTGDQMLGLSKWVRAGGSVCIVPDSPMKSEQLNFLRTVLEDGVQSTAAITLDSDGKLMIVSDQSDPVVLSHYGLGRAVLLPAAENLEQRLSPQELGSVVAFLWKVRKDSPVWRGENWTGLSLLKQLRDRGLDAQEDSKGVYVLQTNYNFNGSGEIEEQKVYFTPELARRGYGIGDRLSPKTDPLLGYAEQLLLPSDVEMVPTWVMGVILTCYVLTVGPVDYFVLGWLRAHKYTWILFPIVTLAFTFLTIAVANAYMGSEDTGGRLVISDLVDDGHVVRQSVIETLYYGSQGEAKFDLTSQLLVQAEDTADTSIDWQIMNGEMPERQPDAPLRYSGHFPQKYSVTQQVQQWSPVSLRSLSLEPQDAKLPPIDWSDASLVTTPEGNRKLRVRLREIAAESEHHHVAMVLHGSKEIQILGGYRPNLEDNDFQRRNSRARATVSESHPVDLLLSVIPTQKLPDESYFQLVSQVSPEGTGSLEDLAFLDGADPQQWALVVIRVEENDFHVFRKLYRVKDKSD